MDKCFLLANDAQYIVLAGVQGSCLATLHTILVLILMNS